MKFLKVLLYIKKERIFTYLGLLTRGIYDPVTLDLFRFLKGFLNLFFKFVKGLLNVKKK